MILSHIHETLECQPCAPAGAGLMADPVLNLGRDIQDSLVDQAEWLVEGHHNDQIYQLSLIISHDWITLCFGIFIS